MGFISKSIFEDILLFIVLENHFPDIEQLSGPQNEALFGILNRENVFAINHIPVLSISLPRIIFKRVSLSMKCHVEVVARSIPWLCLTFENYTLEG